MPFVQVHGVVKEYPGVRALDGVSLDFKPGEVHGVIGENGAGKSTLMKILAGVETPTQGHLTVDGQQKQFRGVHSALGAGIAMIHQELNLVDDLSVAENLFLGREGRFLINRTRMESEAAKWLKEVDARFLPSSLVKLLSLAEKQLVEIAKAVSTGAMVLIMDEPTAVLSQKEKDALFALIKRLKSDGKTVILISHLLGELIANCDRISVLRDGEFIGTTGADEVNERELARMMVGRELGDMYPELGEPGRESLFCLEFQNLEHLGSPASHQCNRIEFHAGEVVGFAGLIGSGRTEAFESVLGLRSPIAGVTAESAGQSRATGPFRQWNNRGVVYISEDRKGAGLHLDFSIEDNIALPWLSRLGRVVPRRGRIRQHAGSWKEALSIKCLLVSDLVGSLSGGNQQKVSLAKWLEGDPRVIVFDEPTRGVDVGSKAQIYEIVAGLASEGRAVIVISSEMNELIGLCHRIVVMRSGRPVAILGRDEFSESRIMELAAGVGS